MSLPGNGSRGCAVSDVHAWNDGRMASGRALTHAHFAADGVRCSYRRRNVLARALRAVRSRVQHALLYAVCLPVSLGVISAALLRVLRLPGAEEA